MIIVFCRDFRYPYPVKLDILVNHYNTYELNNTFNCNKIDQTDKISIKKSLFFWVLSKTEPSIYYYIDTTHILKSQPRIFFSSEKYKAFFFVVTWLTLIDCLKSWLGLRKNFLLIKNSIVCYLQYSTKQYWQLFEVTSLFRVFPITQGNIRDVKVLAMKSLRALNKPVKIF